MRNLRKTQAIRDLHAEVSLGANDFIYPYFVIEGSGKKEPIASLYGVYRFSIDTMLIDIQEAISLGINKILLFGVVESHQKDDVGRYAYTDNNIIEQAIRAVKQQFPEIIVFSDVCLCGYTHHGHCGVVHQHDVDNDATLPLLAKIALSHARAGVDFVAPSSMMDKQVDAIKQTLIKEGFPQTKILSYSAKYASNFYGPFRDAAQSAPSFGNRKTYQMDYRTINQALLEVTADIDEGADWVMVKPAHTYLDIIQRIKSKYPRTPMVAYHVSGEYMMIKLAAEHGLLNEHDAMIEVLTAIKRAGADYIITYYAKDFLKD